jgi:pimeloyl-ACP methyl ester carboxylesterase
LLGHGFLRDQRRMQGLAIDLAALGLPTATLDFCNMRPWRAGVQENAQDFVRLAGQLAAEEVVYAGFSAGGLAALLAAHQDPSSQAVFALDLVDYAGVGRQAAAELQVPLAGLVGEASSCNRFNEALAVYAAASNGVYRQVAGASHCDFESPSDWVCSFVCDSVPRSASEVEHTRSQIRQSALSAIVALANGEEVWP